MWLGGPKSAQLGKQRASQHVDQMAAPCPGYVESCSGSGWTYTPYVASEYPQGIARKGSHLPRVDRTTNSLGRMPHSHGREMETCTDPRSQDSTEGGAGQGKMRPSRRYGNQMGSFLRCDQCQMRWRWSHENSKWAPHMPRYKGLPRSF